MSIVQRRQNVKSKEISKEAKVRPYKTVICPTVTYGSEVWVLKKVKKRVGNVGKKNIKTDMGWQEGIAGLVTKQ